MKIVRSIAAGALLATVAVTASAQQRPAGSPAAAPTTPPQTAVALPDSKIAMIYSQEFLDPKTGIAKYTSLVNTLDREFQPRRTELEGLQTRINTLTKEINDSQSIADPNAIRTKRDQLEALNTEFKRKGEDAQAAFNKRRQDILMPLQQDIAKALEAFAKARGITVIVDASEVPVVYFAETINVTRAFIAEFNSKNPVTAQVTTP
jgi:outer membrane protein